MLQPKRTKFRKQFKGRNGGMAVRGSSVAFGEFGLKATSRARMTARMRQDFEQQEDQLLAPFAMKSRATRGREYPISPDDFRTEFQRDRDRIIHSAAFRKLEYKTQVYVIHEGDYYRTRLTHTLEVAQIGRTLARSLGLNTDLTEAIALSHDLGHTPFGHSGEHAMQKLLKDFGWITICSRTRPVLSRNDRRSHPTSAPAGPGIVSKVPLQRYIRAVWERKMRSPSDGGANASAGALYSTHPSRLIVREGLLQLFPRVHDERTVARYRFAERPTREQQQARGAPVRRNA